MAVKPGFYKVWVKWGTDGTNYPYEYTGLIFVDVTDNTTYGDIKLRGVTQANAAAILADRHIVGYTYTYTTGFQITNSWPANFETQRNIVINAAGDYGINVSLPSDYENFYRVGTVYFQVYLDADNTILIANGNFYSGGSNGYVDLLPRIYVQSNTLYFRTGYVRIPTTQDAALIGRVSFLYDGGSYTFGIRGESASATLLTALEGVEPWLEDSDPYAEIDPSAPAGGDGTFDFSSTPIDFQGLPGIGAYQTGMIDLYIPSAAQLQALSNYLWAGAFDLDNFRKIVADPMDAILGLSIVPVTAAEIGTGSGVLAVGNISTGITMPTASRQYVSVDCGSVNILPKYGAYLDFAPYCKLQLFLPYIGYVQISPDDCMNGAISVRYSVDILSGMCVAQVKCNDHVLYELAGSCSCQCPVTAGQYQNIALTALRVASAGAMTGAALAAGSVGGVTGGIEDAANSIISSVKPEIERSGGFGGSSGLMGHQVPYLILTIPRMCRPLRQNQIIGYPSFVTVTLGDITGYAAVAEIHLRGIPGASDEDLAEIETLLKEGVYL